MKMVLRQGGAKVSLYSRVHCSPKQLAEFHLDVGRKGIGRLGGEGWGSPDRGEERRGTEGEVELFPDGK